MKGAELSTKRRNALPDSTFAFPKQRKMPLGDANHVRNALARFNQVQGVSDEEKAAAKTRIKAAAKKFGIEVSDDFSEWARFAEPLMVAGPGHVIDKPDKLEAGEVVRLPFVGVGEFNFRDSYGPVQITDDDLDAIVRNFRRDARRQDLPVTADTRRLPLNEEHTEFPEGVDPSTYVGPGAVGWIQNLERDGATVYADVELNRLGEQLIRDDRYRAVSPELLLNWIDPETDEAWGKTAAGLALTGMPKMKGLAKRGAPLDERLAASEGRVLAFAELADVHIDGPMQGLAISYAFPDAKRLPLHSAEAVKGSRARFMTVEADESQREDAWQRIKNAARQHGVEVPESWKELKATECARWLMEMYDTDLDIPGAGPEADLDDDVEAGELAPCIYQPPYSELGRCPGYSRGDPDNDGDADCCALAKLCNGYIPIQSRATFVVPQAGYMAERNGNRRGAEMDEKTKDEKQQTDVKASETSPANEQKPATPPAPTQEPADFAELRSMFMAEQNARKDMERRLQASEQSNTDLRGQIDLMKAAEKQAAVAERLDACLRTGRITPAEKEKYDGNLASFAEQSNTWMLEALESRPVNSAVDLSERGSGEAPDQEPADVAIDREAKKIFAEAKASGQSVSMKQAVLQAGAKLMQRSGHGYRG